jgi:hypothetical protein
MKGWINNNLKFLESTANVRSIVESNSGLQLSYEKANQICVCLQQGRLFYEAAENSPWEIRPLLIYYGMMGFSVAVAMARTLSKLEAFPQSHGLKDKSSDSTPLGAITVRLESDGIFHRINDSCRRLEKLIMHTIRGDKTNIIKPTADSASLMAKEFTLKDILARIPDLGELYRMTFGEEPRILGCSHFSEEQEGVVTFTVHNVASFSDLSEIEKGVKHLRARYKFLEEWRVIAASRRTLKLSNINRDIDREFSPEVLQNTWNGFAVDLSVFDTSTGTFILRLGVLDQPLKFKIEEIADHCQPVRGNLTRSVENTFLIEPFEDLHVSEFSLYYLGMFLLSSVVRYRPYVWANAISRRSVSPKRPDDRALALIEGFMDLSMSAVPEAVIVAINEPY